MKPALNTYKMNVDACFSDDGSGAKVAILGNNLGEALAGSKSQLEQEMDATTTEAMEMKNGLAMAERHGCSKTILESNCLEIIQSCNGEIDIWIPYSVIQLIALRQPPKLAMYPLHISLEKRVCMFQLETLIILNLNVLGR